MKIESWFPFTLLGLLLASTVSAGLVQVSAPVAKAISPQVADASASVTRVGMALLTQQLAGGEKGNLAFSPYSLTTSLALLQAGSRGQTALALAEALAMPGPDADFADAFRPPALSSGVQFRMTTGLFLANDQPLNPAFRQLARRDYAARTTRVNFARPETLTRLNAWFAQGTAGKIPALLTRLSPDTRVLVGNALYFKGLWATPFDPAKTQPLPFCASTGCDTVTATVPSMQSAGLMTYQETDRYQRVELPFAGGRYALNIVLPRTGASPADLLAVPDELASIASAAPALPRPLRLQLPRFTLDAGGEFKPALQKIGFAPLFQPSADFSGLSSKPLVFDSVMHKVSFSVDEAGAEAAAATAVLGLRSAMPAPAETPMIVNRPFLALLVDRERRLPLVIAVIQSPAS